MTVTSNKPITTRYFFQFDEEHEPEMCQRYGFVEIILDEEIFDMYARTKRGRYEFNWDGKLCGTALQLMCEIDDFLLDRISDKTEFNIEKSKKETIENLDRYTALNEDELEFRKRLIDGIDEDCLDADFFDEAFRFTRDVMDEEKIKIVMEYPREDQEFYDMFIKYLQPVFEEMEEAEREYNKYRNTCSGVEIKLEF